MPPSRPPGAPRARRRAWWIPAYGLFLFGLVELGALVVLSIRLDAFPPGSALRARKELASLEPDDPRADLLVEPTRGVHPYLGYLTRAGSKPLDAEDAGTAINQESFYAPDSPIYDDDADTLVVGLAGGSVARQMAIAGGAETLVGGMRRLHPRKRLRFVLLAWGGCKQPQQLMTLAYLYALGGRLDVLIEIDGFNEVAMHEKGNQRQGIAPIYPRDWFTIARRHQMMPLLGVLQERSGARIRDARRATASPFAWSSIHGLAWLLGDDAHARAVRAAQDGIREYEPERTAESPRDLILDGPETAAPTLEGRLEQLVTIWKDTSIQMQRLAAANGTRFVLFLQPNQYVPDSKPFTEEERKRAYRPKRSPYAGLVVEGYPKLLAVAEELEAEGVEFHDLTRIFEDVEETLYADSCCHLNPKGYALLAQAIVDRMAAGR